MKKKLFVFIAVFSLVALTMTSAEARITKIAIESVETPAFDGQFFGDVGQYEKIDGKAYGEIDPRDPLNSIIQDIELAPTNANGNVEYVATFSMAKPIDMSKSSGVKDFPLRNK